MSNRLLVNPGTPQAWAIVLRPGVNRIGSGSENDFTINHPSISPQHCEITVTEQAVRLKDLGSTQGTFVERVPVTEIQLYSGQSVQLGSVHMTFEAVGLPPLPDAVNLPGDGAQIMVANPSPILPPSPGATGSTTRIYRPTPAVTAADTPSALPTEATAPTTNREAGIQAVSPATLESPEKQLLVRGVIGAVIGGIVGILAWCFVIKLTGFTHSLIAWGVGALTGGGAKLLARQGSARLGIICGVCALIAIVAGEYYGIQAWVQKEANTAYDARMALAKSAVEAKTDTEIRALLATERGKSAEQISADEIKEFQEKELPELRDFAAGQPSREEFTKGVAEAFAAEFSYQKHFFKEDPKAGLFMVIFVGLGVITAWKLGAGHAAGD